MRRQSQIDMGGPKKIVGKEKNIASKTTNIAGKKEIILQAKNKKYCRHISRVSVRGEDGKPHIRQITFKFIELILKNEANHF